MPLFPLIAARILGRHAGLLVLLAALSPLVRPQEPLKVIIDQDAAGPGGSDMQAMLSIINSPETEVLGITVPTGNAWRDEGVLHTLRMLEIIGRTDIPVVPGAVFPLVSSREYIVGWEKLHGKVPYQGAWNYAKNHPVHGPDEIPPMPEGPPTTRASTEGAAHFLVRMVRLYPQEITIYAAGPLTDLAMAMALEPRFAELTKELIVMGGSIHPDTDDPLLAIRPRREFNFWMDPEAAHAVLEGRWPRVVLTTVDISIKVRMKRGLLKELKKSAAPAARYAVRYAEAGYWWDELAAVAWLDPELITRWKELYIDVDIDHGAGYGETLVWAPGDQPGRGERLVHVQQELDTDRFYGDLLALLTALTPGARAETRAPPATPSGPQYPRTSHASPGQEKCTRIF